MLVRTMAAVAAAMFMWGLACPAWAQQGKADRPAAEKSAPAGQGPNAGVALKEQLHNLGVNAQNYQRAKTEMDLVNARLKTELAPVQQARHEKEFYTILAQKALPALKLWRQDLRARKAQFIEADAELRAAVADTIKLFDGRAATYAKAAPTLRTAAGRKQLADVAQRLKATATGYRDYLDQLGTSGGELAELFEYLEDAEPVLEALDCLARGQVDIATKKATGAGNVEELREFLRGVVGTIDRVLESRQPKLPAVPGPAPAAPARKVGAAGVEGSTGVILWLGPPAHAGRYVLVGTDSVLDASGDVLVTAPDGVARGRLRRPARIADGIFGGYSDDLADLSDGEPVVLNATTPDANGSAGE